MSKITFVVDGGSKLGMGHVVHSLTLAEELRGKAEISLVTCSNKMTMAMWEAASFDCQYAKTNKGRVSRLEAIRPQIVIVDRLEVDAGFAYWVRHGLGARLAIMNCITKDALTVADLVVCAFAPGCDAYGPGNRRDRKMVYDSTGDYPALWMTGPRYWVLRREFYLAERDEEAISILVRIGGSDSKATASAIKDVLAGQEVTVITSMDLSASDMVQTMIKARVAICSPGLTPFEALLVGTPVIIIPQNEVQRLAYNTMPLLEKEDIGKLPSMIERGEFIRPDSPVVKAMQIGQGKHEVIEAIEAWL
jgi:spore coat polysaccharide biosynthesis predicted glycosyltransferase SpsG